MIRKYHNHKPQTTLWHREEEPLNPGMLPKNIKLAPPEDLQLIKFSGGSESPCGT